MQLPTTVLGVLPVLRHHLSQDLRKHLNYSLYYKATFSFDPGETCKEDTVGPVGPTFCIIPCEKPFNEAKITERTGRIYNVVSPHGVDTSIYFWRTAMHQHCFLNRFGLNSHLLMISCSLFNPACCNMAS